MIAAALESLEAATLSRRGAPRRRLRLHVASQFGEAPADYVVVHDISTSGLLLEADIPLTTGERITVELPEAPASVARVAWHSGHFYGCKFERPIPTAAVSAALLQSPFDRSPASEARPQAPAQAEPPAAVLPPEIPYSVERGSLSTSARMQAVIALSVLLWALIFKAFGLI